MSPLRLFLLCSTVIAAAVWAYQLLDGAVNQPAGIQSYNDAFLLVGAIFLAAMPLLLLLVRRPRAPPPSPSTYPTTERGGATDLFCFPSYADH
jgi:hypothetical protein